jgi:hypothetical protein
MKVFQSSIFRALCAIIVGALLVKYRDQAVTGMTIVVGILFFISGLVSCLTYLSAKRKSTDNGGDVFDLYDAQGRLIKQSKPNFPIVGIGSAILGAILALMPNTFVNGLTYVLGAIIILGAINQFYNLTIATRFAHIGFFWWICPSLLLLIGLIAIIKPAFMATMPLLILGWCMMVYGVVEIINSLMIHHCRKRFLTDNSTNDGTATAEEVTADDAAADTAANASADTTLQEPKS